MTEQFDAVLAEMRDRFDDDREAFDEFKIRLAAAHDAEVGERDDLMAAARLLAVERAEFRIRAEKAEVRAEAAERLYAEIEPMYQQQGLNIVRLQKELEAAERDARTLASARLHLPTKVETSKLGDYTPEEMAAFDSGYNLALDRAHNLLNRAPGAIAAIATTEQDHD